ncbi:SpoIIE family protein phosphatase [Spirochaetia bacterium 38H-sp]|uniref:SpoIIE family protein phosphatase n=1 Tax=Rarispira pelagica TaxID=3141764 RepID=A0ABU9UC12_9SPIR
MDDIFVEVGSFQIPKYAEHAEGDVFFSKKDLNGKRIVSVLSDGLGSGIKASVLATLTATIGAGCIAHKLSLERTGWLLMRTLPVCSKRKISYATFTIVDIDSDYRVSCLEYDNPPYLLWRGDRLIETTRKKRIIRRHGKGHPPLMEVTLSSFQAILNDRLIFFSDGVTQCGMGSRQFPLGWGLDGVINYVRSLISATPNISARDLARLVVQRAMLIDDNKAKDDITCGVIYFRNARRLLVMTGPPLRKDRDRDLAILFRDFKGKRIISGGTTATIIARELNKQLSVSLDCIDSSLPPPGEMEGADLVTEGILTLGKVADYLERNEVLEYLPRNPATDILRLMLNSDVIEFVVGTRINEAHQDPSMPVELEIRRNVVRKIAGLLEQRYLKKTSIRFI